MKSTIKLLTIISGVSLLTVLTACEKFEEMNVNPNEPTEVSADVLFASGIRQSVLVATEESFLLGNNAAQITAKTLRTEVDAYNWNAFPTVWEGLYTSLTDLYQAERFAKQDENETLQGAVKVMKVWIYSILTNAYGNIPYSEAIKGSNNEFTPVYDDQQKIYQDLFVQLDSAKLLLQGEGLISGDLIYNGSADKWLKFANSLHLRLLTTAGSKYPNAASDFQNAFSNYPVMSAVEDGAILDYLEGFPNQFPLIPLKTGDFDAVALSDGMHQILSGYADPRLSRYARPNNDDYSDTAAFSGAVNGSNSANCPKSGSRLGPQYYNYPEQVQASELGLDMADGILMSYSELCFILAEAAESGWISADIEAEYRKGIEASMEYHQVDLAPFGWTDFSDFYQNSGVAYSEPMDIWKQKWVTLFFHGLEPYFEVRRWYVSSGDDWSAIPFLNAPCEDLNGGALPMRFLYPGEEESLNSSNYQDAVDILGSQNDRMWLVQ